MPIDIYGNRKTFTQLAILIDMKSILIRKRLYKCGALVSCGLN